MPNSSADLFYKKLFSKKADSFQILSNLVGAEENEWWEFKGAGVLTGPLPPDPSKAAELKMDRKNSIKKYWSENLGSFANSDGGLLIWGIDAPEDVAVGLSLATDADSLAKTFIDLQNDVVDPPVSGVSVHSVCRPGSKEGFVVCHIPKSEYPPHRAIHSKQGYYMRLGPANRCVSTAILRSMFSPRTSPRLVPCFKVSVSVGDDKLFHIQTSVTLKNYGLASAQDTYIETQSIADRPFDIWAAESWTKRDLYNRKLVYQGAIHPHEEVDFLRNWTNVGGYKNYKELPTNLEFKLRIFCQNSPALISNAFFSQKELEQSLLQSKPAVREGKISLLE